MYRVYAQAFFVTSILLAIVILFKPEKSFPFLGDADFYLFLVTTLLYFSFPIVLIGRYLFRARRLILRVESKRMKRLGTILKSKAARLAGNVFGFLLILLVCTLFVWFLMQGFGKFVSRPVFDAFMKFFVRNTVQETLSEMDSYKNQSFTQNDFEELQKGLKLSTYSLGRIRDYLQDKELEAFIEKGAQKRLSYYYGTDGAGNKIEFVFELWSVRSDDINEFTISAHQGLPDLANENQIPQRIAGEFKIKSSDSTALNFEMFKVPNDTGLGILVVWFDTSNGLKQYAIFGPTGERDEYLLLNTWKVECLEGCEYVTNCEQRPTLVVSKNEETGKTEYIIKIGEYRGSHLINYENAGYTVRINELGGLDIERLELRE